MKIRPIILCAVLALLLAYPELGCKASPEPKPAPITYVTSGPADREQLNKQLAGFRLVTAEPDPDGVELISVGLAVEMGQIVVIFKGPPEVVANWWQDSVFVVDEARSLVYKDIPVAPQIGPLIGKPKEAGQVGYCMLINGDRAVVSGSALTVVLGKYRREHVKVE